MFRVNFHSLGDKIRFVRQLADTPAHTIKYLGFCTQSTNFSSSLMLLDEGARIRSFWELCDFSTVKIFSSENKILFSQHPLRAGQEVFWIFGTFSAIELE